jgi:hypothetical protein
MSGANGSSVSPAPTTAVVRSLAEEALGCADRTVLFRLTPVTASSPVRVVASPRLHPGWGARGGRSRGCPQTFIASTGPRLSHDE